MPHKIADPANAVEPRPNSFGENVRRLRKRLDLTQDELAKRVGCARVTIRKVEADEMRPSKQLAELLAQTLDIPVAERGAFVQFARGSQRMEERKGSEPGSTDATLYRRT